MNIKDIVKGHSARFLFYRNDVLYYGVEYEEQEYMFPVPIDDLGTATLEATHKAITLMRYIRKALEAGTFVTHAGAAPPVPAITLTHISLIASGDPRCRIMNETKVKP